MLSRYFIYDPLLFDFKVTRDDQATIFSGEDIGITHDYDIKNAMFHQPWQERI
jgi:hypothetical protein